MLAVLGLCLCLAAAPAVASDLNITAGLDFGGSFSGEANVDTASGYSLGVELNLELPLLDAGVGLEYGFDRSTEYSDISSDEVNYKHVYAYGRVDIVGPFYLTARLGYSDLSGLLDQKGGGTWSAGAGVSLFEKFRLELLFNNFSGEVDNLAYDYETYSARFIVRF